MSTKTPKDAINILKTAIDALKTYNIKLHKVLSNNSEVLNSFPDFLKTKEIMNNEIEFMSPDLHRTLGVAWDYKNDEFTMKVKVPERDFTKRGILSTINSIYDPLGFVGPCLLHGKLFQRNILSYANQIPTKYDWDDILPDEFIDEWNVWKESLSQLNQVRICLLYTSDAADE